MDSALDQLPWWKTAVFYSIWPRSFCDSNGDGIGDLKGITSKLDYLKELGVTAVWLSPIFKSPCMDQGYDVGDYIAINPDFGTLEDVEEMLVEANKRGIRFLFDLVVNHSSDQHEWFQKSKAGVPEYRDYYIWRPGKGEDGKEPPNNWGCIFGGSTWEYNEPTKDFYFHMFAKQQPDLNLENPKVLDEIQKIVEFWTSRGVSGYRLDAASHFSKPHDFPSYPNATEPFVIGDMHFNGPNMHQIVKSLNNVIKGVNNDTMILGEVAGIAAPEFDLCCAPEVQEHDMIITFEHMMIDTDYDKLMGKFKIAQFDLSKMKQIIKGWYTDMKKGWLALYLCNLDQPRIVSRWGDEGEFRIHSAKMLGLFLHSLKGTPYIYQGEEIGMINWRFKPEEADDVEFKGFYQLLVKDLKHLTEDEFMELAHKRSRDTARAPVHWNSSKFGGFTNGDKIWMGMCDNYKDINVEDNLKDPNSIVNFYKKMIALRKTEPLITLGDVRLRFIDHPSVISWTRSGSDQDRFLLFVGNFFKLQTVVDFSLEFPNFSEYSFAPILSSYDNLLFEKHSLSLREYEGILFEVRHTKGL
jgi:oligo-1,6-glucosidase